MILLPNSTSILASGKSGTLAVTVLAADRVEVLVPRNFGTLAEIGMTAVYWGPPLAVDAAASGFVRYDIDGDASTVGVVVDLQPFGVAAPTGVPLGDIARAVWDAAPTGVPPSDIAKAVLDVVLVSPAPGSLGAAVASIKADTGAVKLKTANLPTSPAAVGSNMGSVTNVTGAVGSVTAPVTAGTVTDKGGYSLGATGLDALPMTLNAAPSTFREWFVWLTLRFRG